MLTVSNLRLPVGAGEDELREKTARALGVRVTDVLSAVLTRQSIDARKKQDVHLVCSVRAEIRHEDRILRRAPKGVARWDEQPYVLPEVNRRPAHPPVVVGMGPAGLFAALYAGPGGPCPHACWSGARTVDTAHRRRGALLDHRGAGPDRSNVQFGEGGAGTFSDGKLTTGIHDPRIAARAGRPGGPRRAGGHPVVPQASHRHRRAPAGGASSIREELLSPGLRRCASATSSPAWSGADGRADRPSRSRRRGQVISCPATRWCWPPATPPGTPFDMLLDAGRAHGAEALRHRRAHRAPTRQKISPGPVRALPGSRLPAADYKLACHLPSGRSAFTFCVCPGGQVVAAASDPGQVVTNGMSLPGPGRGKHQRRLSGGGRPRRLRRGRSAGRGALSGDSGSGLPSAWAAGIFRAPAQRVEDFLARRPSAGPGRSPAHLPPRRHAGRTLDGCSALAT